MKNKWYQSAKVAAMAALAMAFPTEGKAEIKEAILDGVIPNEYDAAFALMEKIATEKGLAKK